MEAQQTDETQSDMLQALRSAALPDEFWMYSYKILPCPHGYRHSWTHCPFSHGGETARRRCPRTHHYLPDPCVNARAKRQCPNGDACPYAHNTFEQWLHPARYRTRLCYLGANCRRPTCFFAHSVEELRSVDENESGGNALQHPSALSALPPALALPPPLPSSSSGQDYSAPLPSNGSAAAAAVAAIAPSAAVGTPSTGPMVTAAPPSPAPGPPGNGPVPMGLFQPIALVCMPQTSTAMPTQAHTVIRPDLMRPPGPAYVTYDSRTALPRPAMAAMLSPASQGHVGEPAGQSMHGVPVPVSVPMPPPQGMVPMAVRPQPRQHPIGPTVALATVQGGQVHLTPAGPMYVHGGVGPMAANVPPQPQPVGYVSGPYGVGYYTPSGHLAGGEGVPPSVQGRTRSWSNPGESFAAGAAHLPSGAPPPKGSSNGHQHYQQHFAAYGIADRANQAVPWATEAGRRVFSNGLPPGVSAVPASALSPAPSPPQATRPAGNSAAPRHMPAPTNRGAAVRRVSTPASLSSGAAANATAAAAAAAAATAAVAAMRYPASDSPGRRATGATLPGSGSAVLPPPPSPPHAMHAVQSLSGAPSASEHLEAALQSMTLTTKPVAAPPPTPAASHAGGSPYSRSLSTSPLSAIALTTVPSVDMGAGLVGPGGRPGEFAFSQVRASTDGGPALAASGAALSRPSSAGSSSSGQIGAFDASAAAAAAALAAVAAAVDPSTAASSAAADTVGMPYRALLHHVLRSASASAAEPPSAALLPALLGGCAVSSGPADIADMDGLSCDDVDGPERSSDPGSTGSLRAAIRRISTELGSAAVNRNSDPGQTGSAAGVQQLLLPLLQSVLTEGLATGQFELVNGQLQVKGSSPMSSSGPSGSGFGAGQAPAGPVAVGEAELLACGAVGSS